MELDREPDRHVDSRQEFTPPQEPWHRLAPQGPLELHHHPEPHQHRETQRRCGDPRAEAAFRWSIALNSGLTVLQLVIGVAFGSLALIGDALHNLGDVVGLALGWGAERLSRRPARGRFTYGYGRSTQMAPLINGVLICAAGGVVVVEAVERLLQPVSLIPGPVAWAAAAGIAVNLASARLFGHHHHDLNQRAAVLHLLTDAAVSVAVLISALLVGLTGWVWLDALTALAVGAAVIGSALGLLREAIALNLDAAPRHVDLVRVRQSLLSLPGVRGVEDLHVWAVSSSRTALTAHLLLEQAGPAAGAASGDALIARAHRALAPLGISHTTLQLEQSHEH